MLLKVCLSTSISLTIEQLMNAPSKSRVNHMIAHAMSSNDFFAMFGRLRRRLVTKLQMRAPAIRTDNPTPGCSRQRLADWQSTVLPSFGILFIAMLSSVCVLCGGVSAQDQYATINSSCAVTLFGDYEQLRSIVATSTADGQFVQDSREIEGVGFVGLNSPFLIGGSVATANSFMALSGPGFDASGETETAILYTGSLTEAESGLGVQVMVGEDLTHTDIPFVVGEPANYAACADIQPNVVTQSPSFAGVLGGIAADEQYISIVDGMVTLNGTFEDFSAIEVTTTGGALSQQTVELDGIGTVSLTTPFSGGQVIQKDNSITLGVLGADKALDIVQSQVKTAILYAGSDAEADLTVQVGRGATPISVPVGGVVGSADGSFLIDDEGFLTLTGDFTQLSGLQANSANGLLSLASQEVDGQLIQLTDPFDPSAAIAFDETDGNSIILGVDTAAHRIDSSGTLRTSIRYAGTNEQALQDLSLQIGIAGQGAVTLSYADAQVPEPSSRLLGMLGLVSLLALRRR